MTEERTRIWLWCRGWFFWARAIYKVRTKKHGAGPLPWKLAMRMAACYRFTVYGQRYFVAGLKATQERGAAIAAPCGRGERHMISTLISTNLDRDRCPRCGEKLGELLPTTEWRPMSIAPQDRFILLYCAEDRSRWLAKWQGGRWYGVDDNGLTREGHSEGDPDVVTGWAVNGWMALPELPPREAGCTCDDAFDTCPVHGAGSIPGVGRDGA